MSDSRKTVEIEIEDRTIPATDGFELAATHVHPQTEEAEGWVVIHSAIAMPRRFYRTFARWLGRRGYHVITYDYRGIGDSGPDTPLGRNADISDWIAKDLEGVVDWAASAAGCPPLYMVGHSLGGQIMGTLGDRHDIDMAITVAAQTGYWRRQYPGEQWKLAVSMTCIVPVVTRLVGYLPWSRVFGGEDLPKRAALQWASWCRDPDYLFGDSTVPHRDAYDRFSCPVVAYSFEDDEWGYEKAVDWMMAQYTAADVERRHLAPEEIGHFSFFFPELEPLWREILQRWRDDANPEDAKDGR
jgi:predicted alpha/beta hydrolase